MSRLRNAEIRIDLRGARLDPSFVRLSGLHQVCGVISQGLGEAEDGLGREGDRAGLNVDQLGSGSPVDVDDLHRQGAVNFVLDDQCDFHRAGLACARMTFDGPAVDWVGLGNFLHRTSELRVGGGTQ